MINIITYHAITSWPGVFYCYYINKTHIILYIDDQKCLHKAMNYRVILKFSMLMEYRSASVNNLAIYVIGC